jgi:hypothetical protein
MNCIVNLFANLCCVQIKGANLKHGKGKTDKQTDRAIEGEREKETERQRDYICLLKKANLKSETETERDKKDRQADRKRANLKSSCL